MAPKKIPSVPVTFGKKGSPKKVPDKLVKLAAAPKVKVVRTGGPKRVRRRKHPRHDDPVKQAKFLAKNAKHLSRLGAHFAKLSAKTWGKAAKLATKTLADTKRKLTDKQENALEEIALVGNGVVSAVESATRIATGLEAAADAADAKRASKPVKLKQCRYSPKRQAQLDELARLATETPTDA